MSWRLGTFYHDHILPWPFKGISTGGRVSTRCISFGDIEYEPPQSGVYGSIAGNHPPNALQTQYSRRLFYFLVSSATEAWEIIAQSLTLYHSAHHYNGAFGKKWFSYASHIVPQSSGSLFPIEQTLTQHLFDHENDVVRAEFNRQRLRDYEVLCLTHSETSNGTHIRMEELAKIRTMTDALIAIDATSSLGALLLIGPWAMFGLPRFKSVWGFLRVWVSWCVLLTPSTRHGKPTTFCATIAYFLYMIISKNTKRTIPLIPLGFIC